MFTSYVVYTYTVAARYIMPEVYFLTHIVTQKINRLIENYARLKSECENHIGKV
jgi:hypothetical protein